MEGSLGTLFVCGEASDAQWAVCEHLWGLKVKGVFGNFDHSVCVADGWELYSWKDKLRQQLHPSSDNNETVTSKELEEQQVIAKALEGVRIQQVAFGKAHALGLSLDGEIFSWGTQEAVMQGDLAQTGLFGKKQRPGSSPKSTSNQNEDISVTTITEKTAIEDSTASPPATAPPSSPSEVTLGEDRQVQPTPPLPNRANHSKFVPPKRVICSKELFFCKIAVGEFHCAAINSKNELYTWGRNLEMQLGHSFRKLSKQDAALQYGVIATPKFVPCFLNKKVVDVACGESSTVVVLESGEIFGFGTKSTRDRSGPTPHKILESAPQDGARFVSVACGQSHSLALSSSGQVYAWGLNVYGQLGIGTPKSTATPQAIEFLPTATTKLARIFAGGNYSAAISTNGELFTWGNGAFGKLGHETNSGLCATKCEWTPRRVERLENVFVSTVACEKRNMVVFAPTFVKSIAPQCGDLNGNYQMRISGSGFWSSDDITVRFVPLSEGSLARGAIGTFDEKSQQIVCWVPKFVQPGEFAVEVAMNGKNFTSNGHIFEAFCAPRAVLVSLKEARASGDEPGLIKFIGSFPQSCQKPLIRFVAHHSVNDPLPPVVRALGITLGELTIDEKLTHDGEHQGFVRFMTPPLKIDQLTPCTLEISFNDGVQFLPVDIRLKTGAEQQRVGAAGGGLHRSSDSTTSFVGVPHVIQVHDAQVVAIVPNCFLLSALPLPVSLKVRDLFDLGPGTVSVGLKYLHRVKNKTLGVAEVSVPFEKVDFDSLNCMVPALDQWHYTPQTNDEDYDLVVQSDTPWFRQLGFSCLETHVQLSLNGGKSVVPCGNHRLFGFCQGSLTSVTPNWGPIEGGTRVEIASNFFHFDTDDVVVSVHWRDRHHLIPGSCRLAPSNSNATSSSSSTSPVISRLVYVELPPLPFPKKPQDNQPHLDHEHATGNVHRTSSAQLPMGHESTSVPTPKEEVELAVALNGVHFAESTVKFNYYEPPNLIEITPLEAVPGTKLMLKVDKLMATGLARIKLTNANATDPIVNEIVAAEINESAHTVEFVVPTLSCGSVATSLVLQIALSLNGQQFVDKVAGVTRNPSGGSLTASAPPPAKDKTTKGGAGAGAGAAAAAPAIPSTPAASGTPQPTTTTTTTGTDTGGGPPGAPAKLTFVYKTSTDSVDI